MVIRRVPAALIFSAMLLSGCSDFGGPISGNNGTVLSPEERRLQDVETKAAQLSRRMDQLNLAQTDSDVGKLKDDLRGLRGDVEKLRYDLDSRDKSNKDLYMDLDRRMQRLEQGGGAATAAPVAPPVYAPAPAAPTTFGGPGTVSTTSPGTIAPSSGSAKAAIATPEEERAYLGTFDLLKNGKYDDAIAGFRAMLAQWPDGRYADNGWYWMGEAQRNKGSFADAAVSFQTLTTKFPSSPKAADGLYKLGICQYELKKNAEAKATLQRVLREFPNTTAAKLAKAKLDQNGG